MDEATDGLWGWGWVHGRRALGLTGGDVMRLRGCEDGPVSKAGTLGAHLGQVAR